MDYSRQLLSWTRSVTFRSATLEARGAWTMLNGYCADQRNGGRIERASCWTDRQWELCADCTRAIVEDLVAFGLATWQGDDLLVAGYDAEGETLYAQRSTRGAAGANARWSKEFADLLEKHGCANDPAAAAEWKAWLNQRGIITMRDARSFLTYAARNCSPLRYPRHISDITFGGWRRESP